MLKCLLFGIALALLAATAPAQAQTPVATTITTSAPTPLTFTDVLAAPSGTARHSCAITNIGTTQGYCQLHPTGFTPTTSNTIPVPANGGQFFCSGGPGNTSVGQEAVSCTCASGTCAFVVNAQ